MPLSHEGLLSLFTVPLSFLESFSNLLLECTNALCNHQVIPCATFYIILTTFVSYYILFVKKVCYKNKQAPELYIVEVLDRL